MTFPIDDVRNLHPCWVALSVFRCSSMGSMGRVGPPELILNGYKGCRGLVTRVFRRKRPRKISGKSKRSAFQRSKLGLKGPPSLMCCLLGPEHELNRSGFLSPLALPVLGYLFRF